jgi:ElaB/YqjD/DUF883 family membrane-anchored ribosome-binding protein
MATDEEFQLFRQELQKLQQDMALTINTLKDRAAGEAEKIYERLRNATEEAKTKAEATKDKILHEFQEHPLGSFVGAFGIAMLLGILFSRRL